MTGTQRSGRDIQTRAILGNQALRVALWALLLLVSITVGLALGYFFASRHEIVVPPLQPSLYTSNEGALLKTQIEYYEKRADDLQKLVSALTGLSALFALVAGVTTYLNLTNSVTDAKKLLEEVKEDYPLIGFMNQAVLNVIQELTAMSRELVPKDANAVSVIYFFRGIKQDGEKRTRLLFYEKIVAALSLLDIRLHEKELSHVYRVLGLFYASRASEDRKVLDLDDLELGCFYLKRAFEHDRQNHLALAEMGRFLSAAGTDFFDRAVDALRKSLQIFDDQQWPWMNLSFVYLRKGDYNRALNAVVKGLGCKSFAVPGDSPHPEPLHFNGVYAMIGLERLDDAMLHFEKACRDTVQRQRFQNNLDKVPDDPLYQLVLSKHAARVQEILHPED